MPNSLTGHSVIWVFKVVPLIRIIAKSYSRFRGVGRKWDGTSGILNVKRVSVAVETTPSVPPWAWAIE